jgi:hypothetical protein
VRKIKDNAVIFDLLGGIGNQLFIYFAGQYFENETGKTVRYQKVRMSSKDSQHMSGLEDLNLAMKTSIIRYPRNLLRYKLFVLRKFYILLPGLRKKVFISQVTGFDPNFTDELKVNRVHGYFQSYKYHESLMPGRIIDINVKNPSDQLLAEMKLIKDVKPISLHIRRGDYRKNPDFGLLSKDYYTKSIELAESLVGASRVWVFSDDLDSAAEITNFISPGRIRFMRNDLSDTESLMLMSNSAALIIANSSFSYWAGVLGSSSKVVISPSKWFRNIEDPKFLYPTRWIQIPSAWEDDDRNL